MKYTWARYIFIYDKDKPKYSADNVTFNRSFSAVFGTIPFTPLPCYKADHITKWNMGIPMYV